MTVSQWLKREPVIAAALVSDLPLVTGLVTSLSQHHPSTTTTVLLAVAIPLLNGLALAARQAVTPVVKLARR